MKEEIQHRDRLGQIIKIGDFVVAADNNRLSVGVVNKINPKMIQYTAISDNRYWNDRKINKYPDDVVVTQGSHVTMFLLKRNA